MRTTYVLCFFKMLPEGPLFDHVMLADESADSITVVDNTTPMDLHWFYEEEPDSRKTVFRADCERYASLRWLLPHVDYLCDGGILRPEQLQQPKKRSHDGYL